MIQDPRRKNIIFNYDRPHEYLTQYSEQLQLALQQIDREAFDRASRLLLETVKKGGRVYVAGNGGSAAISDHLCCDFTKGARSASGKTLRTHSLVSNTALLTALGNDYSYEESFSTQVDIYLEPGDVLILISSSGNSPNILRALDSAQKKDVTVIGFSGFKGGGLAKKSDISLHVPFENYGIVEDAHQMMMHSLAQVLAQELDKLG